jgi:hypothetical protein
MDAWTMSPESYIGPIMWVLDARSRVPRHADLAAVASEALENY